MFKDFAKFFFRLKNPTLSLCYCTKSNFQAIAVEFLAEISECLEISKVYTITIVF